MHMLRRLWAKSKQTAPREKTKQPRFGDRHFAKLSKRLDELGAQLDAIQTQLKLDSRWKAQIRAKIDALLRTQYLPEVMPEEYPFALSARRFHLISQNEEDGMTLALLAMVGVTDRTFIEIGSGINGGNSGFLADELGWRGLMAEIHPERAQQCALRFGDPGRVTCICAEVTPDNINTLLADHGFTGEVDLFSLDIDSFDYWVFEAMTVCSPRIVILEYNGSFGPDIAVTIPLGVSMEGTPKSYHGASLAALSQLAERKGYRLLACDMTGTNAFFLRNDLRPEVPAVSPSRAFRRKRRRFDPFGEGFREMVDAIAEAKEKNLPLHFLEQDGEY